MKRDKEKRKGIKARLKDLLWITGICSVPVAIGVFALVSHQYWDVFGPDKNAQLGRTKNSIAVVVAGLVGHRLYGDSNIDVVIEKKFWPDAKITGHTSPSTVETHVKVALASAHFIAQRSSDGLLEGEVEKSEFDWKIKQTQPTSYEIQRFGPKFDAKLELEVQGGKISGKFIRIGPHFDWFISGTYDQNGNVNFVIDGRWNLGITLKGKVSPK